MTKRLFAYLGLSALGTFTAVFYFGLYGLIAAAVLVVILFVYAFAAKNPFTEKSVIILVAAVIVCSSVYFTVYDNVFKSKAEQYNGQNVTLTATLKSDGQKRYGMYNYDLQVSEINNEETDCRVMLCANYRLPCEYGDTIRAKVKLSACDENYYRSRKFVFTAESEEYSLDYKVINKGSKDICYLPIYLRNKLAEAIRTVVRGDNGELCSAMIVGTRDNLSSQINKFFSKTGLSFLIVISGLHMGIISALILFALKPLEKRKRGRIIRFFLVLLFIVLYMFTSGLTASVVRSGIAVIITIAATAFNRQGDSYNNLGLAAIFLTITNPYAVGDIGMLLSYSSMLGIIYLYPRLSHRFNSAYKEHRNKIYIEKARTNQPKRQLKFGFQGFLLKITDYVVITFFVSLSAVTASIPVVCLAVGYVNPTTLLWSMILTPLTALVVWFGLLTALLFYLPLINVLAYVTGFFADIFSGIIIYLARFIYSLPYITLYLDRTTVMLWLLVFALLAGLAIILRQDKRKIVIAFLLSIIFLAASYGVKYAIHANTVSLRVINSGAPTVTISGGGVEALLMYGGEYGKLNDMLRELHTSCGDVKTLVVGDDSIKTSRFALNFLDEFDVERVMLYHSDRTAFDLEQEAMSVKSYDEFYSSDILTLDFGQEISDTLIHDGKSTWHYVQSPSASVLLAPDKADADRLFSRYRTADIIVRGSEIQNIDMLHSSDNLWITKDDLDDSVSIRLN